MIFRDYSLITGLLSWRGKRDFHSFVDQELNMTLDDTPANRVHAISLIAWKENQDFDTIGASYIYELESMIIPVLARMEHEWVRLDGEKMTDIWVRVAHAKQKTETEIYGLVWESFNIASPKQIQEIFQKLGILLTKKNKTGYSVDVDVLEEIAKTHDIARLILEHRTLAKLESTYVSTLLKAVDSKTGRIHTTYDSLGASTGRMSSNDPNLQNIPTGDGYAHEIKSCFIPTNGNIFLVADYSQIELRVLAFLSGDQNLISAFQNHEDIHMRTAKFLFGENETISSGQRRIAKSVNFWVIYGITGFGLSKTLECSPWEAKTYIDAFYTKYPWVRIYYDMLLETGRQNGYVETYFGRRRNIPGLSDANKMVRAFSEREAMNMPIQWTAADILKIAMIDIDAKIREKWLKGKMILQVHDELVFDIPPNEKAIFETLVRESMENVLENFGTPLHKNFPLTVDIHVWDNWADTKG